MRNSDVRGGNPRRGMEVLWGVGGQIFVGWGIEVISGRWEGFLMHIDFAKVDWGDFTSETNVLFSLAAFVAAAIASVFAKRLLCNNSDRRNHELQDRLSIQASRVSAWSVASVGSLGDDPDVQSYAFAGVTARIRNGSDQPIYGVESQFFYEQVSMFNHQIGIVPPQSTIEELLPSELLSRLSAN